MPLPTTRKERWLYRKRKYAKRLRREQASFPRTYDHGGGVMCEEKRNGPWAFEGDGRKQQSLYQLIKNPPNTAHLWNPTAVFVVSTVGYKKPPHVYSDSVSPLPSHYHSYLCGVNYNNRPMRYRGRKKDRMRGQERAVYFANLVDLYQRLQGNPGGYPPWDPLARTPVIDDPDAWFPRHVRHCHGQPIV